MSAVVVKAVSKNVRMSPRKVQEVARLVKGRSVSDALTILEHVERRAAKAVHKTVSSAAANAENNNKLDPKTLQITSIEVGQGFAMKRFRPAAHGRALPYKKMTSNIMVYIEGIEKKAKTAAKKSEKAATKDVKEDKKADNKTAGEEK